MTHPYVRFENGAIWQVLDRAIADLEENQDLTLTTARTHVLGYLCKQLAPLQYGGSLRVAMVWRWLCNQEWPPPVNDDERLELARDIVRIADAGTIQHVALHLRDALPMSGSKPMPPSEPLRVAEALMAVLTSVPQDSTGAGAF